MTTTVNEAPAGPETGAAHAFALLRFGFPILGISLLQSIGGSLNVVYVGTLLGPVALAATSNANTLIFLTLGVLGGLSNAVMLLIGRAIGRRDHAGMRRIFKAAMVSGAALACGLGAMQWLLASTAVASMGVPANASRQAVAYMETMSVATPLMFLFSVLMMAMRGAGQTRGAFLWMAIGIGVECALTPALITGWGPFPAWGVEGAAASSTVAQLIAFTGLIHKYKASEGLGGLGPSRACADWASVVDIAREGLPMCLQMLMGSAYSALVLSKVNDLGSSVTAAYAIVMQTWSYVQMPAMAMASATAALAARYIGANMQADLSRLVRSGLLCNLLITGALVSALLAWGPSLMASLLAGDLQAQHAGSRLNLIAGWSLVCFGSSVILFAILRAQGRYAIPLLTFGITQYGVCWPFILWFDSSGMQEAIWWSFTLCYVMPLVVGLHQLRGVLRFGAATSLPPQIENRR